MAKYSEKELRDLLEKVDLPDTNPFENINLFSILGMENKEVSAHSAFLYYIFKPFKNRNKIDDENARILLREIIGNNNEFKNISLYREYSTDYGRLDFFITYRDSEKKKNGIVIELKIWAKEQKDQLKRYKKFLKESGYENGKVFFLTPIERKSETGEGNEENITLTKEIKNVLLMIKQRKDVEGNYKNAIDQYINLCEKLSGDTFMDYKNVITEAEEIIKIDELNNLKKDALTALLTTFMSTIEECKNDEWFDNRFMESTHYEPEEAELSDYYLSRKVSWPAIAVKVKDDVIDDKLMEAIRKANENVDLYFFIEIGYGRPYAGLTLRTIEDEKLVAIEANESTIKRNDEITKDKNIGKTKDSWLCWSDLEYEGRTIDFRNYANDDIGMLRLFEGMQLKKEAKDQIIKSIKKTNNDICEIYLKK